MKKSGYSSSESNIPWNTIKGQELEKLVYDIFSSRGAKELVWRKGSIGKSASDGGRDLECTFHRPSPFGELESEKWWVQVKGRKDTIKTDEVKKIINHIVIAYQEVDVIVIATNSIFTNATRDWIDKVQKTHKRPKIKMWDQNTLDKLIIKYCPAIIMQYDANLQIKNESKQNTTVKKRTPVAIFDTIKYIRKQNLFLHSNYNRLSFVKQDFAYAKQFLLNYTRREATYNTYRREIERYLQWLWLNHKSILQVKHQDIELYLAFCSDPPKNWIAEKHAPRFILKNGLRQPNPTWRPFDLNKNKKSYSMSQAGWESLFAVLGSFHKFLIKKKHTEIDPIIQIDRSRFICENQSKQQIRRLTKLQWNYVIETAEIMANRNPKYERTLFIMSCLYGMYLKISELAANNRWIPNMNHFHQDSDGKWWFKTGNNKKRNIPVSDGMLEALKRYRKSQGLLALPSPSDTTPLIVKERGDEAIASTRQIRTIVKKCFDQAIKRMKQDDFSDDAEQLEVATVHWLRHTGISDDVKNRPWEHVRDDAGHSSGAITEKYIDTESKQRHATAKRKTIKSEDIN
ncbi:MAG: restriction endonuclease [Gammaproteobacteria bacterium]|jgi:site-specific recombinase XerD